jgi:hypothetical protein
MDIEEAWCQGEHAFWNLVIEMIATQTAKLCSFV